MLQCQRYVAVMGIVSPSVKSHKKSKINNDKNERKN